MSKERRTVENGGKFSQSVYRPLRRLYKICPCCKQEKASIVDHIKPWQWGGDGSASNCGIICSKCNEIKTAFEDMIEMESGFTLKLQMEMMHRHVEYWWRKHFTPSGKRRRPITIERNSDAAVLARKVSKGKMQQNLVKRKMTQEEKRLAKYSPAMIELMAELDEISAGVDLGKVELLKGKISKVARARKGKKGVKKTYLSNLIAQGNVN